MSLTGAMTAWAARTRGGIADRLLRLSCLTALSLVPLYFNPSSLNSFQRDKTALLHCLAVVMLVAWAAKLAERIRTEPRRGFSRGSALSAVASFAGPATPIVVSAAVLLLVQAVSTASSVAPRISLSGDYNRAQGLYSAFAYVVVFATLAANLRDRQGIDRAIDIVLIGSAPIALYGVLQRYGIDPLVWGQISRSPVQSTMGNEIFVSAYLIMLVPLTLHRLIAAARAAAAGTGGRWTLAGLALLSLAALSAGGTASMAAYAAAGLGVLGVWGFVGALSPWRRTACWAVAGFLLLLSAQLACIVFSESRGPFLGLLAGLGVFGLICAGRYGGRRVTAVVALGLAVALIGLVAVNVPGSPLAFLAKTETFGRLTDVLTTQGPAQVRLLIWRSVMELAGNDPGRLVFGHGLDTTRLILQPYYPPDLAHLSTAHLPDRAHSDSLDWLVTTGAVGLTAYVALIIAALAMALRLAGILASGRETRMFAAAIAAAIVASGAALWSAAGSAELLGLAVPAGVLMAVGGAILVVYLRRETAHGSAEQPDGWRAVLAAALVAALVAHLVESHVGIVTVSTRLIFWTLCGLIVAAARVADAGRPASGEAFAPSKAELAYAAFLIALTLGLVFELAGRSATLSDDFTWLFVATIVVTAPVVVWSAAGPDEALPPQLETVCLHGAACVAGLLTARMLTQAFGLTTPAGGSGFAVYVVSVGLLLSGFAVAGGLPAEIARGGAVRLATFAVVTAAGIWFLGSVDIRLVRADEAAKRGWSEERRNDFAGAVKGYRAAAALAPGQDHYLRQLATALSKQAYALDDAERRDRLFAESDAALRRATALSPLDVELRANRARLWVLRADKSADAAGRVGNLTRAADAYAEIARRSPGRPEFWTEWTNVVVRLRRDMGVPGGVQPDEAGEWGRIRQTFLRMAEAEGNEAAPMAARAKLAAAAGRVEEAIALYRSALDRDPQFTVGRRALAALLLNRGDCREAGAVMRAGRKSDWADPQLRFALERQCGVVP